MGKGLTTDTKPTGTDTPAKKQAVAAKRKTSLPPGPSSAPQSAKKPKPSSSQASAPGEDIVDMVEPHLEDVDIKSIKAEPEPSGSGAGGGGPHGGVEADLHGDESYGAEGAGDDNGDFGAEGEFEGFDQYGDGNEFDDSMGAAGGSGAAADGKALQMGEEAMFVRSRVGSQLLSDKEGFLYKINNKSKKSGNIWWKCREYDKVKCMAKATTAGHFVLSWNGIHNHQVPIQDYTEQIAIFDS